MTTVPVVSAEDGPRVTMQQSTKIRAAKIVLAKRLMAKKQRRSNKLTQAGATASLSTVSLVGVVDLAATPGHHHIKATTTHWRHGWIPLDIATAARYKKKNFGGSTFHRVEPEEFNGHNSMPKFVGSAHHNPGTFHDTKPVMKYSKNKHLTGHLVKTTNGENKTIASLSASHTHVQFTDGTKASLSEIGPANVAAKAALHNFVQGKFKSATEKYKIHSSFGAPKSYGIPKAPKVHKEPTLPKWKPSNPDTGKHGPTGFKPDSNFPELTTSPSLPQVNYKTHPGSTAHKSVVHYTGSGYSAINRHLRGDDKHAGSTTIAHVTNIDKAFSHADTLGSNPMLHRGTNVEALRHLQPGNTFVEPGFSSTSRDPHRAFGGSTTLHITVKKAKALDVQSASLHPHEREVLLHRNTSLS